MNSGKTVFSQLMDFLPSYEFRLCVDRYHGNDKVKSFSWWDQFLSMAFAQLIHRESLRDIETSLRAAGEKLYHMGIRGKWVGQRGHPLAGRSDLARGKCGGSSEGQNLHYVRGTD